MFLSASPAQRQIPLGSTVKVVVDSFETQNVKGITGIAIGYRIGKPGILVELIKPPASLDKLHNGISPSGKKTFIGIREGKEKSCWFFLPEDLEVMELPSSKEKFEDIPIVNGAPKAQQDMFKVVDDAWQEFVKDLERKYCLRPFAGEEYVAKIMPDWTMILVYDAPITIKRIIGTKGRNDICYLKKPITKKKFNVWAVFDKKATFYGYYTDTPFGCHITGSSHFGAIQYSGFCTGEWESKGTFKTLTELMQDAKALVDVVGSVFVGSLGSTILGSSKIVDYIKGGHGSHVTKALIDADLAVPGISLASLGSESKTAPKPPAEDITEGEEEEEPEEDYDDYSETEEDDSEPEETEPVVTTGTATGAAVLGEPEGGDHELRLSDL